MNGIYLNLKDTFKLVVNNKSQKNYLQNFLVIKFIIAIIRL
jgi:hypothetical protein